MFTNELKKGTRIRLRNGWEALIEDNLKGNTRLCTVYGYETEMGSVYSHDITARWAGGYLLHDIEYTPSQLKCRERCNELNF